MKPIALFLILTLSASFASPALGQTESAKRFFKTRVKGKRYYLKHPVIRIEHGNPLSGGEDATNVINNQVRYMAHIPGAGLFENISEGTNAQEFKRSAELKIAGRSNRYDKQSTVRFWDRGTQVLVHNVKYKDKGKKIYVDVTFPSRTRSRIRLYFGSRGYSVAVAQQAVSVIFAKSKAELEGAERTVQIAEGMTIDQVIEIQGKPKQRVSVGSKTVLIYDGMKLIFRDGKLVDVE